MPRTCEVIEVAMARPAASSLAELIRLPVDRRSMAVPSALPAEFEAFDAYSAPILVLMTFMALFPLVYGHCPPGQDVAVETRPA